MFKSVLLFLLLSCCLPVRGTAQTACDSLEVHVRYHPFYDSLIEVKVVNHGNRFFNYPGFVLYGPANDTVAKETLNLFGIASSSSHILHRYPTFTGGHSFSGRLDLYTYGFDSLTCSFPSVFDLCPDTCSRVVVYLGNMGGAWVTGSVHYTVKDAWQQSVHSGMLSMGTAQHDEDTLCLLPGLYTIEYARNTLSAGGAKYYCITQDSLTVAAPSWLYQGTNDTTAAFSFYKNCMGINPVQDPAASTNWRAVLMGNTLRIGTAADQCLDGVAIFSVDGRCIYRDSGRRTNYQIDAGNFPPGLYLIQSGHFGHLQTYKLIIP